MSPRVSIRFLQTQTDGRLVVLAGAGHERAFEALVLRYRKPLLAYCRRLMTDMRAEDALQQALLQAWMALRDGTQVGNTKAWLYGVVHNVAVSNLRRSEYDQVEFKEGLHEVTAEASDQDIYIAMRHALSCVAALPDTQREVIVRTAIDGDTQQDVARALGLSNDAVRGLVYRARSTLRAAAAAVIPAPLIQWLAPAESPPSVAQRLFELSAGGGSAGVAGLLLKGGAVVLGAGALVGGAAVVHTTLGHANGTRAQNTGSLVVRDTKTPLGIVGRSTYGTGAPAGARSTVVAAAGARVHVLNFGGRTPRQSTGPRATSGRDSHGGGGSSDSQGGGGSSGTPGGGAIGAQTGDAGSGGGDSSGGRVGSSGDSGSGGRLTSGGGSGSRGGREVAAIPAGS